MNKRGFTLIELLVVISIIMLLSSVVLISLKSARDKARYAQVILTLNNLEKSATFYFVDNKVYPIDSINNVSPPGFSPKYLLVWPKPPCSGWVYDWDNWSPDGDGKETVRITMRRPDISAVYYYCIYTTGNCTAPGGGFGNGSDIKTISNKTLTCNE